MAASNKNAVSREVLLIAFRTMLGMLPALLSAAIITSQKESWTVERYFDIAGFFAVLMLAMLSVLTLTPERYHRFGRMGLVSYALWACSSALWRLLSFFGIINGMERLWLNSTVAGVLVFAGIYVMFTHRLVVNLWHYTTEDSIEHRGELGE